MKPFTILTIILAGCISINAQQIYFSQSITDKGKSIGAKNVWEIKPWGSFLYITLDNEGKSLQKNILYLFIDKMEDDVYQPFDSKAINIDYDDTWASYNYKFVLPGQYKAYFISTDKERLAEEEVSIKFEQEFVSSRKEVSRSYYDNCRITFCEKILVGGEPLGVRRYISMSKNGSSITVLVNNYAPLNTSKFLVDVWRKKNRAFDYDEFVESKKYRLNPDWSDAFFKYTFKRPGEYKFSIYNEDEVLIDAGYITVYE